MLESRSAYGYYGAAGGVTGENRPRFVDKYSMNLYDFEVMDDYTKKVHTVTQKAKNHANAERHIKKWCRDTHKGLYGACRFTFIGSK